MIEALTWSALSMMLASGGHTPSGPALLPIDAADYYAAQVWFAPPIALASFALQTVVVGKLGDLPSVRAATIAAVAVSAPTIVFWQCGDLLAYAAGGFDALGAVMRFTVPLALLSALALTFILARRESIARGRSTVIAVAVLVVRGLVFAPFVR